MENQDVLMLKPEHLLADSNIRFGLKPSKISLIADSITRLGEVHTPLVVEELEEKGPKGETHIIRDGHYRQAAALKVNKDGAGVLLPCVVTDALEGVERLKRQISANMDRENMSPMDTAKAAKELLDAGLSKTEVREVFKRAGGRKGTSVSPLSNSMLNIFVSFLDFPKKVQNYIHDGTIGVGDAYKLSKRPKEQWDDIIAQAENDREAESEAEDKLEAQYLAEEKKAAEAQAKIEEQREAIKAAEEAVATAKELARAKAAEAVEANNATLQAETPEAKAKAEELAKKKKADATAADKAAAKAAADASKLAEKAAKQAQELADRRKKLEAARKSADKGKKLDTESAADKLNNDLKALNANEIRKVVDFLNLPGGGPKVIKIGLALKRCFYGVANVMSTDQQLLSELSWIVGEKKDKPKHVKE